MTKTHMYNKQTKTKTKQNLEVKYFFTYFFSDCRLVRFSGSSGSSENKNVDRSKSPANLPRKILLDCGANTASTVDLFRETYPGGHDFIIHSFEIDDRLAPYFAPYANHVLHCPMGVSNKNGMQSLLNI